MPKAELVFQTHKNSFSVKIENLEKLSVEIIKELQTFVQNRKGIFDFNTYSFSIQKKINIEEFEALLSMCGIDASITQVIDHSHAPRVSFGQYKGMLYKELPDSYLLWLKSNYNGPDKSIIQDELQERKI